MSTRPPAPWIQRLGARLLDGLLLVPLEFGIAALLGYDLLGGSNTPQEVTARFLAGAIVALLYFPLLTVRWNGQTIGKRVLGIRVTAQDGSPIDYARATSREVATVVFAGLALVNPVLGLLGFADGLSVLFRRDNRALHDLAAATRVERAR